MEDNEQSKSKRKTDDGASDVVKPADDSAATQETSPTKPTGSTIAASNNNNGLNIQRGAASSNKSNQVSMSDCLATLNPQLVTQDARRPNILSHVVNPTGGVQSQKEQLARLAQQNAEGTPSNAAILQQQAMMQQQSMIAAAMASEFRVRIKTFALSSNCASQLHLLWHF